MKVVLDTDVLVAAFRSPTGGSAEILRRAELGQFKLAVSVALLFEYEAVLTRPEHCIAAGLAIDDALVIIDNVAQFSDWVWIDYTWRPQTRDPADEMVLETAINGQANCIISFNKGDFGDAPERFGLECVGPGEFLEKLR